VSTTWIKQRTSRATRLGMLLLASALLTSTLSGCTGALLESKVAEPSVYVLRPGTAPVATVAYPVTLSVALPSAAPGLDVDRIAVLRNGNQLDYYYGVRWGGAAPQVMQSMLVARLQAQQGLKNVSAEGLPVNADYLLALELRDFQAEYASDDTAPSVRVTLVGTLVNIKTRAIANSINATALVAARNNRLGEVVTAFDAAAQQAAQSVSEQIMTAVSR
jgi:cholesterol transport system auxiliary component